MQMTTSGCRGLASLLALAFAFGCQSDSPLAPSTDAEQIPDVASLNWGDQGDGPHYNLNVLLQVPEGGRGFGFLFFRQPVDDAIVVYLDTWVLFLAPNSRFQLQRATDNVLDGTCTGANWLTLGELLAPKVIETNKWGTGHALLSRTLANPGNTFDIHFRIINAESSEVVLSSRCHEFTVRQ